MRSRGRAKRRSSRAQLMQALNRLQLNRHILASSSSPGRARGPIPLRTTMMERSRERLGPKKSSLWGFSVLLSWWWSHRAWAAGRPANAGETATEAETSRTLTFLRNAWRWPAVPLFASRPLQPRCGFPRYSNYRYAFPRPGLGVMPSSQSTPAVAQPGLDTAANRLRSLGVLVFWALPETCHRLTPAGSDWPSPTTMPPVFIS